MPQYGEQKETYGMKVCTFKCSKASIVRFKKTAAKRFR